MSFRKLFKPFTELESLRYVQNLNFWGVDWIYEMVHNSNPPVLYKKLMTIRHWMKLRFGLKMDVPPLDFTLTNRCSLRCENCASMMPYYSDKTYWTIDFEQYRSDCDKFLKCVDVCWHFKLIGGEPFIVSDFDKILEYTCRKRQIRMINITTNGTIIPSDAACEIMRKYRRKIVVTISDYSCNKELENLKHYHIVEKLKSYGVIFSLPDVPWIKMKKIIRHHYCKEKVIQTFKDCWQKTCIVLWDGELHLCTRAVGIHKLNRKLPKEDYIDVRNSTVRENKKRINEFFKQEYFSVCDYCSMPETEIAPKAKQTKETLKIPGNSADIGT